MSNNNNLSSQIKFWAFVIGYSGVCIAITYYTYKSFAKMMGRAVVKELIKAGIVKVL